MGDSLDSAVRALQAAIRCRTVSDREPALVDREAFADLHDVLAHHFPLLHQTCELISLGGPGIGMALLFRWPGTDSRLPPVVMMAHQDVVPVDESDTWTHPPFDGAIADGVIWGRGALDCKGSLIALCAAAEHLLGNDFRPQRDIWFSFGCDEEISGSSATQAVHELGRRGVQPWFVLDEGGAIAADAFPGLDSPLAVIGVGEKGTLDLRITAHDAGGHSSTPARGGATVRLAKAIVKLDRSPFPANLPEPTMQTLRLVSEHLSGPLGAGLRAASKSRRLLAAALLAAGPETAAMARTTLAVTQLTGSPGRNVIATSASAVLNLRIMVGESVSSAIERIQRLVGDESIELEVLSASEPSELAPTGDAFDLLVSTVATVMPDVIAAPYVVLAATDARFFQQRWPHVYRVTPFRMSKQQRGSLHNADEHLRVEDFEEGIRWYGTLFSQL